MGEHEHKPFTAGQTLLIVPQLKGNRAPKLLQFARY